MIGAIIITHGKLAEAIVSTAEAIAGRLENVRHISIDACDSAKCIGDSISSAIKTMDKKDGIIILTDMFGGTPSNIGLSFLEPGKVEILTGVNLPMLLKFAGHRADKGLLELAALLKEHGQKSIVLASEVLKRK
ncbi:MAG: PTS sugar transporter [Deltaproteobacteria bacterium]|nr:PTS sugar transporter [Deltaproteobacteria bacterium]